MNKKTTIQEEVVIKFAGDSGDGMQLTGTQFTDNTALIGNDFATFPNYPAEIRAPQGTLAGVSGFQIHFGSREINTPGDDFDVLVAMNAAALKDSLPSLKQNGILVVDESGFDKKNLRLSGENPDEDRLVQDDLKNYQLYKIDITKLTKEALADYDLPAKEKDRAKNMFVLGFLYWLYNRDIKSTAAFLEKKFAKKELIRDTNIAALKTGYHYGDTIEAFSNRYEVKPAPQEKGTYRNIMGNQGTAIGLIAAAHQADLPLFYGSYPITPASDVLHELAKYTQDYNVQTFQAEDEIAAVCSSIGASFGGALGATGTSGPGLALKSEAINLALMLELPLVVIDVQRAGPSTGMPTKTEQSDLLFAMYGRNGDSPIPIISASTPSDCFEAIFEATRIAVEHMTPVIFLSDGYIANGSEPWKFPKAEDLSKIKPPFAKEGEAYLPYKRDEKLVRQWAVPGMKGLEHRLGGLEKEQETGNVSYNPENHEAMTQIRAEKVEKIANYIPLAKIDNGVEQGDILMIGWGSTYGAIRSATKHLLVEDEKVAHLHLRYINPFPKNLKEVFSNYKKVLVPEINNGQLVKLLKEKYTGIDFIPYNKVKGIPITKGDLIAKIQEVLK